MVIEWRSNFQGVAEDSVVDVLAPKVWARIVMEQSFGIVAKWVEML